MALALGYNPNGFRPCPRRHLEKWSALDDHCLVVYAREGRDVTEVSALMERTAVSVAIRIHHILDRQLAGKNSAESGYMPDENSSRSWEIGKMRLSALESVRVSAIESIRKLQEQS